MSKCRGEPDDTENLHDIRALGMSLALGDFGTGYSNFAYLQKVPAIVVKVDQSVIRDVHTNPRDQRIVHYRRLRLSRMCGDSLNPASPCPEVVDAINAFHTRVRAPGQ